MTHGSSGGDERMAHGSTGGGERPAHESDVLATRRVYVALGALTLLVVLGWAIPTWLQVGITESWQEETPPANPLTREYGRTVPPAPRLQVNPDRDIESYRAAQRSRLSSYGWVDREAGIAHIPIDRAMALVAEAHAERGEGGAR